MQSTCYTISLALRMTFKIVLWGDKEKGSFIPTSTKKMGDFQSEEDRGKQHQNTFLIHRTSLKDKGELL